MNEFFLAYLVVAATSASTAVVLMAVASALGIVASAIVFGTHHDGYGNQEKNAEMAAYGKKWLGRCSVLLLCFCVASAFLPSKRDLAYIAAIGLGLKAMKNEQMQKLPDGVARLLNKYIEDALTEEPKPK